MTSSTVATLDPSSDWRRWHGMSEVAPLIEDVVGISTSAANLHGSTATTIKAPADDGQVAKQHQRDANQRTTRLNGWALLGVSHGLDALFTRLTSRLDNFSLVSGLLLAISLNIISAPALPIVEQIQRPSTLWQGQLYTAAYLSFAALACMSHFSVIILGSLFSTCYRASVRDADAWRLICKLGWLPGVVDACFTIGNVCVAGLLAVCLIPSIGFIPGIAFGVAVALVCGLILHIVNGRMILPLAHGVHGFVRHHPDAFNMRIPYQTTVQRFVDMDRMQRKRGVDTTVSFIPAQHVSTSAGDV